MRTQGACVQSDRYRRHCIAGSSVRDHESLASSSAVPSYMAPTQSTNTRSRLPSPLGPEINGTPERGLAGSAKKRLSFPASPARNRRHSGPPKVDITTVKDIKMHKEEKMSNGGGRECGGNERTSKSRYGLKTKEERMKYVLMVSSNCSLFQFLKFVMRSHPKFFSPLLVDAFLKEISLGNGRNYMLLTSFTICIIY
ncbi:hypothetical protein CRYUN_Cryun05aG0173800 [Craigia yunnanensis]